jgi:homocitrate synthase NifV
MKEKRQIIDTTLRDGEQSPHICLSGADKLRVAELLIATGVTHIEAGISAMGIAEQRLIGQIVERKRGSQISVWARLRPEDVKQAIACGADVVHVTVPTSYLHIYTKLGKNKYWVLNRLNEILEIMEGSTAGLSVGFEDASRADLSFLMKLLGILEQTKIERIRLADTVGAASSFAMRELVRTVKDMTAIPLEIHAHNDLGMAVANTAEAMKAGARYADTTLLGIGERSGNCSFSGLLKLVQPVYDTGIPYEAAITAEEEFKRILKTRNSGLRFAEVLP